MWKLSDGTTSETYVDGATFLPSEEWQQDNYDAPEYLVETISNPEISDAPGGFMVAYRAIVRQDDEDTDGPDYEMGAPVIFLNDHTGPSVAFGKDSEKRDGLLNESAVSIIAGHGADFFERYLRIFHSGNVHRFSSYDGRGHYLTYDTAKMREGYWGQEPGYPSRLAGGDFEAWVNGETFSVEVERTFALDDDGEPDWGNAEELDGRIYGYYGELWAKQAAEDDLAGSVENFTEDVFRKHCAAVERNEGRATILGEINYALDEVDQRVDAATAPPMTDYLDALLQRLARLQETAR